MLTQNDVISRGYFDTADTVNFSGYMNICRLLGYTHISHGRCGKRLDDEYFLWVPHLTCESDNVESKWINRFNSDKSEITETIKGTFRPGGNIGEKRVTFMHMHDENGCNCVRFVGVYELIEQSSSVRRYNKIADRFYIPDINFTHSQTNRDDNMSYQKVCKICKKEFESDARNTMYCSDKCAKRGAKRAYRSRKMKHMHSASYATDKDISKIVKKAYCLSREIASMFLVRKCDCPDCTRECASELEVHHIDHNPFNMDPSNLKWVCKKEHARIHSNEHDCDFPNELKAYLGIKMLSDSDNSIEDYINAHLNFIKQQRDIRQMNEDIRNNTDHK